MLTFLELCTGYNGLGMAVAAALNARPLAFADNAPAPAKILARHYPGVPNLGDITAIDWAGIPRPDIISGGTPCQDLSHSGRRAGMTEGTRSNLWVAMREAIAVHRPRYVVWENVRGAYSARADSGVEFCPGCMGDRGGVVLRALGRVLGDLTDLGYDTQWRGLRASDVGACHARHRVFILAALRHPLRPDVEGGRARRGADPRAEQETGADRSAGAGPAPDGADLGHERAGEARGRGPGPADRGIPAASTGVDWGKYGPAIRRWEKVTGRPAPRPTEPTGRTRSHRLSPYFTEWMMGLPAGWVTDPGIGLSRAEQLRVCGDGVVPQQAYAALNHMLAAHREAIQ